MEILSYLLPAQERKHGLPKVATLSSRTGATGREQFDYILKVRVACAELPGEPVASTGNDRFPVDEHIELAGFSGLLDSFDLKLLLDKGCETRSLGLVALSRRAVVNLDIHLVSLSNRLETV